jgi:hypothetical protein
MINIDEWFHNASSEFHPNNYVGEDDWDYSTFLAYHSAD